MNFSAEFSTFKSSSSQQVTNCCGSDRRSRILFPFSLLFWTAVYMFCNSTGVKAQESIRETPAVHVIRSVQDSVVPLFTFDDRGNYLGAGTGVFIDRAGFLLTADHVVKDFRCVVVIGMKPVEAKLIGKVPERDIAVLKVELPDQLSLGIELGRSANAMLGEPIILGGNPSARGVVFSQGTINAVSIEPSWPNFLAKAIWAERTKETEIDRSRTTGGRIDFIQYDATTNRGNSGGPLVNYDRKIIGISVQMSSNEDGIFWAIPVDRIRMLVPHLFPNEAIGNFWTGVEVDLLSEVGLVESVTLDSPGWQAGIRPGDSLKSVDGVAIGQAYEWYFRTWGRAQSDTLDVDFERNGEPSKSQVHLTSPPDPSVAKSEKHVEGLQFKVYEGVFPTLNSFKSLSSAYEGTAERLDVESVAKSASLRGPFAIEYQGYLEIDKPGLYRLSIASDDGSKLYIQNKLLIDNDMGHPLQVLSRVVRLSSGLTPIRLEYSDLGGDKHLELKMYREDKPKDLIPLKYFHESEMAEKSN